MQLLLLEELLSRCDALQSFTTQGKFDDWFVNRFRLSRILNWNWFKSFYLKTYVHPFARELFVREIRYILLEIRSHYKNYFLSTLRTDSIAEKAIKIIDEYLENLPKRETRKNRLVKVISYVLPVVIPTLSVSFIIQSYNLVYSYLPLVLLLGIVSIPPTTLIFSDKWIQKLFERYWFNRWFKKLRIFELKKQIIEELVHSNNQSFSTFL